ncbi:MAG: SRPBCC family protein [Myxococcota bacterium]
MMTAAWMILIATAISAEDADGLRWSHQPAESGMRRGWAQITVDAPADVVWKVVTDVDAYADFLPYVTASSVYERRDDGTQRSGYSVTVRGVTSDFVMEGPLSPHQRQWCFVYTDGPATVSRGGRGCWRLNPTETGATELEYEVFLPRVWWIPKSVEARIAEQGLTRLVLGMAARAERIAHP